MEHIPFEPVAEAYMASYFKPSPFYDDAKIVKKLGDGLVVLHTFEYGVQIWARAIRAQRKIHRCVLCGKRTTTEDRLFRPVANSKNRMHRACEACIDDL